jgi:hypothetical protein
MFVTSEQPKSQIKDYFYGRTEHFPVSSKKDKNAVKMGSLRRFRMEKSMIYEGLDGSMELHREIQTRAARQLLVQLIRNHGVL